MNENTTTDFISHLKALRLCVIRSLLSLIFVFLLLIYFSNDIYHFVAKPLLNELPNNATLQAIGVASPWLAPIKLTFMVSLFAAMPFILYQFWSFIAPALYKKEKKRVLPLLCASIILFYLGILFAYFVLFPIMFAFFTHSAPSDVLVSPDINQYLSFVLSLFFAFGLAFQIPVFTLLLCMSGIVTIDSLKAKRPYIFVGSFVLGMLLTPPDIFSQTLLAVPMYLLFELALFLSRFYVKSSKDNE